jgi:hypothetical protein
MEKDKRGDMPADLSCCPSPQSNVPCQIESYLVFCSISIDVCC